MKELIEKVKKALREHNNVAIYCGKLEGHQVEELSKHFKVRKEYFGYYYFENK